ncbi:HamA C-terminal domain-containing protein [Xanthobacter versatilis]|uniref:HamA C-terminal domain-containing protein n=1 Tax=Xanthobacter autotrophicus (strain ATCC BAA-1158 / Py2) TaxID=78245 RepID=UPI003726B357
MQIRSIISQPLDSKRDSTNSTQRCVVGALTRSSGVMVALNELPDPFLQSLFAPSVELDPITLCAGFDGGKWRCEQLANHLTEWVLEFSLRAAERNLIPPGKIVATVREAAARVFERDAQSRGEAGEILLHAACRQEFSTKQLVARIYYKSSVDQQVHGFDCVHFRETALGEVQLWLGESKLYKSVDDAIAKARASIKSHLDRGFLKSQKLLILPKIVDENAEFASKVQHLFHANTPLDDFLSAMVVPVLIACDSEAVGTAAKSTPQYLANVQAEMLDVSKRVRQGSPFSEIRIQPIYVPLRSKEDLRVAFGVALKGLQQ